MTNVTEPTSRPLLTLLAEGGSAVARFLTQGLIASGVSGPVLPSAPGAVRSALRECPVGYARCGQRELELFLAAASEELGPHGP